MNPVTQTHIVPSQAVPIRIQEYGIGIFDACPTRSALKKAIKKRYVKVNGVVSGTGKYIRGGEAISLTLPVENNTDRKLSLSLDVLFEDDYLALVHKPAGIPVSGNKFKTIDQALSQNLRYSSQSDAVTPQPIHRLDYETTGVLLIGKSAASIRELNKLFENHQIEKIYFAVTMGEMNSYGTVDSAIEGRPAQSQYKVMQTVSSKRFGHLNLVQLKPLTGKRHQLRIHMLKTGNPVLGDRLYGVGEMMLHGKGLYLHAFSLKFRHPATGEIVHVADELPGKFKKIFDG